MHLEYEKATEWFAYIDIAGTLYAVPDRSRNYGFKPGTDVPKALQARRLQPDDEIFSYDQKYILDSFMQIRYGNRMKVKEMSADHIIYPGNADYLFSQKERILKGVLI